MNAIIRLIPYPVRNALRRQRESRIQREYAKLSVGEAFERVYSSNAWGVSTNGSFCSGDGSDDIHVEQHLPILKQLLSSNRISSVADLGCGNFNTGRMIAAQTDRYVGVDVAEAVIAVNTRLYGSERVRFVRADLTRDPLPPADAAIVRQVFQHLSNREIAHAIDNILSTYPLLIITEHVYAGRGCRPNLDIPHGPGTRVPLKSGVFVDQAPFNLKATLAGDIACGTGGSEAVRTWVVKGNASTDNSHGSPAESIERANL